MNYYISDLHFGHKNILAFDNRPFFTLSEMQDTIISNWNSRVTKADNVYILGDMFWYNEEAPDILDKLKGNKFLVLGNHDRPNTEMVKRFVWCDKKLEYIKDQDCINGGEYNEEGIWQPSKEGLGIGHVLDTIGVNYKPQKQE